MNVLSICTSAGLFDKAFVERGHTIIAGCELMEHKRAIYRAFVDPSATFLAHDLADLLTCEIPPVDLVIGGPPCQSLTKLRAMRALADGVPRGLADAWAKSCEAIC